MPTTLDLDDLRTHIARTQTTTDLIHAGPARFLRRALARPHPEFREGDLLPPASLALYFLPSVESHARRPHGSPQDTGGVPPMAMPRRMFAGERVRYHGAVRVGETVRRETRLADISVKHGGTGTLEFATVTSRVYGPQGIALEDERRTVFRDEVKVGESNQAPRRDAAPTDVPWRQLVTPDPVMLFRYSALTFNSHRIHYDRAWAMDVEGYPGLVVHGPLTTTLLVDFARDSNRGRRIVSYATQARAPLFDTAPFELRGRPTERGGECWAVTPEGTVA